MNPHLEAVLTIKLILPLSCYEVEPALAGVLEPPALSVEERPTLKSYVPLGVSALSSKKDEAEDMAAKRK